MATTRQVRSIIAGLRQQGLTQLEIGDFAGLSRSLVSGLLSGRRDIDPERATDVVERFTRPAYQRALEALDYVRDRRSLRDAARGAATTPATVRKYAGRVLYKDPTGEWRARSSDRLPRVMKTLAPEGEVRVLATNSKQASSISRHGNALRKWRETGDRRDLDRFEGRTMTTVDGKRVPLVTDEATLRRLSDAGELTDVDDLYA